LSKINLNSVIFGLYYKHITIVNDNSSIINKGRLSFTDNTRVIIYYHNIFILKATACWHKLLKKDILIFWQYHCWACFSLVLKNLKCKVKNKELLYSEMLLLYLQLSDLVPTCFVFSS
jgi:hypothetical protein